MKIYYINAKGDLEGKEFADMSNTIKICLEDTLEREAISTSQTILTLEVFTFKDERGNEYHIASQYKHEALFLFKKMIQHKFGIHAQIELPDYEYNLCVTDSTFKERIIAELKHSLVLPLINKLENEGRITLEELRRTPYTTTFRLSI